MPYVTVDGETVEINGEKNILEGHLITGCDSQSKYFVR
jgi:hypothetical protein